MHRKPISAITVAALLVLASLACNAVTGGGLNNAQATANAALTAAASGDFAATADAAQATADALIDNAGQETAAPAATEEGIGSSDATKTPDGVATDSTGFGSEAPSDVPIIDAQNTDLFASAAGVSYQAGADYKTVVAFYKDGMPKNGWAIEANASIETDSATILYCTKDNRQATVAITPGTAPNTTLVFITITSN